MRLQKIIVVVLAGCLVGGCANYAGEAAQLVTGSSPSAPPAVSATAVQNVSNPPLTEGSVYLSMAHDPVW